MPWAPPRTADIVSPPTWLTPFTTPLITLVAPSVAVVPTPAAPLIAPLATDAIASTPVPVTSPAPCKTFITWFLTVSVIADKILSTPLTAAVIALVVCSIIVVSINTS